MTIREINIQAGTETTREYTAEELASYVKTPEQLAAIAQRETDSVVLTQAKADVLVQYLATHTPQECFVKVMADVTNFAQLKENQARMAMALSAIARKQLR